MERARSSSASAAQTAPPEKAAAISTDKTLVFTRDTMGVDSPVNRSRGVLFDEWKRGKSCSRGRKTYFRKTFL
jgi:hypothetical protein